MPKMKKYLHFVVILPLIAILMSSCNTTKTLRVAVYETSEAGNQLSPISKFPQTKTKAKISILPEEKFQIITGFGGSFTESSASLLNQLSKENRNKIIEAYFGESGAKYSLTRTHMNSCTRKRR